MRFFYHVPYEQVALPPSGGIPVVPPSGDLPAEGPEGGRYGLAFSSGNGTTEHYHQCSRTDRSLALKLRAQRGGEARGGVGLPVGERVRVGVERDGDAGVARALAHDLYRLAGGHYVRNVRVPADR